ncbi:hypothetical protein [Aliikangiella maris]|uniref:Uncharacterized protein n=2 Tax=Aliikangiella maris TaxID=3162458 RepID=A0ABV2BZ76_9GAMM
MKYSEQDIANELFINGRDINNYYLEEIDGDYAITLVREDGVEGNWLIDDEEFRLGVIALLKKMGVKIIKLN